MAAGLTMAAGAAPATPDPIAADLARVAQRRVVFGHQSVGGNVVEGLTRLAAEHGGALRVAELKAPARLEAGTFAHAYVDRNGAPLEKLESFDRLLASLPEPPDVALVKFCWIDIEAGTDVAKLFAAYQAKLQALKQRYPRTVFVHVTTPLTTIQSGPKAWLKRAMGKSPWGLVENERREAYNALLRSAYEGKEPLFDLARLEAHGPDGAEARTGATLVLAGANTDDGGHLNGAAQARIAAILVNYLASLR